MKKFLSVICVAALLLCSSSLAVSANSTLPDYSMTRDEWNSYCNEFEGDNTMISLTPGSNETELNFAWHSDILAHKPSVRISKNSDMSDYTEFIGSFNLAETLEQKVNKVTATGLEENTVYYYTYGADGEFSAPVMFRTLSSESFKVLFVSDIQCNHNDGDTEAAREMAYDWQCNLSSALSANDDISFILSAGDQTHHGDNAEEWEYTLSPKALRSIPLATTLGNHDSKGTSYSRYVNNPNTYLGTTPSFSGNDYWFRYGDVLFIVLNPNNENLFDHFNFAKEAVMQNTDAKWRVGVFHHDIYGTAGHASNDENILLRSELCPIADIFEFDIILTGHDHVYGRSYYMYNNKIVDNEGYESGSVTDPEGTIYFTASAASDNSRVYDEPFDYDWLGYTAMSEDSIYTTLEFGSDSMSVKSYYSDTNEQADEFNITKTDTTFADTSDVSTGDYLGNAFEILCGDYYFIVEILINAANTVCSVFSSLLS